MKEIITIALAVTIIAIAQMTCAQVLPPSPTPIKAGSIKFDGFLDTSDGKRLTCKNAEEFNESHDATKTMASCAISGKQAREKTSKEGRDITKATFLDSCIEGSCRIGVWREEREMQR